MDAEKSLKRLAGQAAGGQIVGAPVGKDEASMAVGAAGLTPASASSVAGVSMPESILSDLVSAPPREMPLPEGSAGRAARKRAIADQARRRGRASTILTDVEDRLGG